MPAENAVLKWSHGIFSIQALGGMIGAGAFTLPDGRQVSPLFIAPWWNEAGHELDGLTTGLRGEWPCVPFGYPMPKGSFTSRWQAVMDDADRYDDVHGYSSNHAWQFVPQADSDFVELSIDYPVDHSISHLVRRLRGVAGEPRIDLELEIHARQACRMPVALHACFALPSQPGAAQLIPGAFKSGSTFPGVIEPGAEIFAKDEQFTRLIAVPSLDGKEIDASHLPLLGSAEELLQLNDVDGRATLRHLVDRYEVAISWDKALLPSILLWYSNKGRQGAPWLGRTLCIGIEPSSSAFGLSPRTSAAANPIATAGTRTDIDLAPDEPLTIRYSIAVNHLSAS